ncbi:hypothetical protein Tco_0095714 [Tanacetum coccineum]
MESPLTSQRLNALTVRSWECKFAKYQANRANGSKEKRIVPIEDSKSKALVAKDSQEDDWSIEIDANHVDLGQDRLGVFDWSEEADNAPVALALMATSSTDSSNSEGNLEEELKDHAIIDSGCSGSMTGDKDKLSDFKEYKGGYVAFGNDPKGGRITGNGTIKTSCIDFENVNSNSISYLSLRSVTKSIMFSLLILSV